MFNSDEPGSKDIVNYSKEVTNTSISEIKYKKLCKLNSVTNVKNEIYKGDLFKRGFLCKETDSSNDIPLKESSKSTAGSSMATTPTDLNSVQLIKPFGRLSTLGTLSSLCPVSPMSPFPSFTFPLNPISNQLTQFASYCSSPIQNGTSLLNNKRIRNEQLEPSSLFSFYGGIQMSGEPSFQQYFIS